MNLDRVIAVRNNRTLYRDGNTCIKVFRAGYCQSQVMHEVLNQTYAQEAGLHVPNIRAVHTLDGEWAVVTAFIRGKTLAQLMEQTPQNMREYVSILVDTQIKIQHTACPHLIKMKDMWRDVFAHAAFDEQTTCALLACLEQMEMGQQLCHFDLEPSNLIVESNGDVCVLDWAHAVLGDGAADVARTYLMFLYQGDVDSAALYLALYCEKSGIEEYCVKQWIPLAAAYRAAVGSPMEAEFMRKWVTL